MTLQNVYSCSVALGDQWDVTSAVSRSRRQPWLWLMGEQSHWVIHNRLPLASACRKPDHPLLTGLQN